MTRFIFLSSPFLLSTILMMVVFTDAKQNPFSRRKLIDNLLMPEHGRGLEISAACITATEALFTNNPALEAAEDALSQDLDNHECPDDATTCIVDEDTFPSATAYKTECTNAGGVIYEYDISMVCLASVDSESETFSFQFLNIDLCVSAAECTATDIGEEADNYANEYLDYYEDIITALDVFTEQDISLQCAADVTVSDESGVAVFTSEVNGGTKSISAATTTAVGDYYGAAAGVLALFGAVWTLV